MRPGAASWFPGLRAAWEAFVAEVPGRRVWVAGHTRPDGDCIGSQVALARLLRERGAAPVCVNADPVPRRLAFLVEQEPFADPRTVRRAPGDLVVEVDCADERRVGRDLADRLGPVDAVIDHHLSNPGFGRRNILDPAAAATAEVLAGLAADAGWAPDALAAEALYCGIAADTGHFRYPSTTPRVLSLAAWLVGRGADPARTARELHERESPGRMRLLGRFLDSLHFAGDGWICLGHLPDGVFAATGATGDDTEGLVDYARAIDGTDIGVLLEERDSPHGPEVKGSLRSKDERWRMDRVAGTFGGGGHACAAGFTTPGRIPDVEPRVVAALLAVRADGRGGRP